MKVRVKSQIFLLQQNQMVIIILQFKQVPLKLGKMLEVLQKKLMLVMKLTKLMLMLMIM